MKTQDKIIAFLLIAHGVVGIVWTCLIAWQWGHPPLFVGSNLLLAGIGIAAGIGWMRQRKYAAYVATLFYLVQLVHIATPEFSWSYTLGIHVVITAGWYDEGAIGVNLYALAMWVWVSARAFMPGSGGGENGVRDTSS